MTKSTDRTRPAKASRTSLKGTGGEVSAETDDMTFRETRAESKVRVIGLDVGKMFEVLLRYEVGGSERRALLSFEVGGLIVLSLVVSFSESDEGSDGVSPSNSILNSSLELYERSGPVSSSNSRLINSGNGKPSSVEKIFFMESSISWAATTGSSSTSNISGASWSVSNSKVGHGGLLGS